MPTAAADLALDLRDVAKTYRGKVHALRGIEMHVGRGEIFGLLGPNGAGKSTLVKILMTVVRPTRCEGHMLGAPVGHKPTLARVGYLPEHHRFPDYLTGEQVLDFFAALAGVPRAARRRRAPELLELVGLREWGRKRVKAYSKGMRQRLGVAQALMNDPELVLLDEPTDGVDPVGRRDIRTITLEMKRRGKTVFINSHLLSELEMVCDRVAILVQGVVASQGTIDSLTKHQERYDIELGGEGFQPALLPPALPTGEAIMCVNSTISVATADAERVQPLIDDLRRRGLVIRSIRPVRPTLEDLFMQAVADPSTGTVLPLGAGPPGRPAQAIHGAPRATPRPTFP